MESEGEGEWTTEHKQHYDKKRHQQPTTTTGGRTGGPTPSPSTPDKTPTNHKHHLTRSYTHLQPRGGVKREGARLSECEAHRATHTHRGCQPPRREDRAKASATRAAASRARHMLAAAAKAMLANLAVSAFRASQYSLSLASGIPLAGQKSRSDTSWGTQPARPAIGSNRRSTCSAAACRPVIGPVFGAAVRAANSAPQAHRGAKAGSNQ